MYILYNLKRLINSTLSVFQARWNEFLPGLQIFRNVSKSRPNPTKKNTSSRIFIFVENC